MSPLSRKAWAWLVGSWAAASAVTVGSTLVAPAAVERTDPHIPVITADLVPPTATDAASGSGAGEQGGPTDPPTPTATTAVPPPTTTRPAAPKPPPVVTTPAQGQPIPAAPRGTRIVAAARTFFGIPYVWGGTSRLGLDCSGLVVLVMRVVGLNPPRTAAQQANWVTRIPASQAQPGDLVFQGSPAFHVGIFIGGGQMIDAQTFGTVVGIHKVQPGSYYGRVPS